MRKFRGKCEINRAQSRDVPPFIQKIQRPRLAGEEKPTLSGGKQDDNQEGRKKEYMSQS
jgi:hypothetical protein